MRSRAALVFAYLGSAVALVAAAVYWPVSTSSPVPRLLTADVAMIAFAAALIAFAGRESASNWSGWVPWIGCGLLLGAAAMGPLLIAPWLILAGVAFAAAGLLASAKGRRRIMRWLVVVFVAATVNFVLLFQVLLGQRLQAPTAEFGSTDFRVHTFLADVPLHDVWVMNLRGGGEGRTLRDVQTLLAELRPAEMNTTVAGLIGLRMLVGFVLGWDAERHYDLAASYINKLSSEDRARSLEKPGVRQGLFTTVYTFENEALAELMNATAHAFFCRAMEPAEDGYTLYWAIYLKEGGLNTKVYMFLIDPFRRLLVYPTVVQRIERAWVAKWSQPST